MTGSTYDLLLQDLFTYDLFTFDLFTFDLFTFDLFTYDLFTYDLFTYDLFTYDLFTYDHQLGRLVSESACERKDPGSNPAADMVDAARNTACDLVKGEDVATTEESTCFGSTVALVSYDRDSSSAATWTAWVTASCGGEWRWIGQVIR
ncbi:hypothetical protein FHG87_005659 [Trinorchestia longiramus]|nr:hypothetical protein FHG87_005659 [Trinorchestia longiramus]